MGSVPPWLQISIGNVYYAEGFFDKAQDSYNESFRNFLKLSDIDDKILNPRGRSDKLQGMAVSKNNLAMIAEEKKEYSAAEELYKEALSYRLERQQYDDLAHSYLHLAQLYLKSNELDQVSIYCDSSEMMVDELFKSDKEQFGAFEENVNRYKGMSNQYKAQLNFKLGNKALMQTYLDRANKFYAALPIERARLLEISASMHHELGEFKKALQEIDAGLEIAQSQGLTREEEVLYTTKKEGAFQHGQHRRSCWHQRNPFANESKEGDRPKPRPFDQHGIKRAVKVPPRSFGKNTTRAATVHRSWIGSGRYLDSRYLYRSNAIYHG